MHVTFENDKPVGLGGSFRGKHALVRVGELLRGDGRARRLLRFEAERVGPGAEVEASRGCPYNCTFCAKENFRDLYRRRPPSVVLEEVDRLRAQGVEYIYFIDEIFLKIRSKRRNLAFSRSTSSS